MSFLSSICLRTKLWLSMSDKTDYNAEEYAAPVNNEVDAKSFRSRDESNHSDEEMVVDPMHAPLKRQLQSRHLQMIAIGGLCLVVWDQRETETDLSSYSRNYWSRIAGRVRYCSKRGRPSRCSNQFLPGWYHRVLRHVIARISAAVWAHVNA